MQTLKTAVVVVLLLGLLYGVYVVLSKPEAQEAASHLARELVPPRIEQGAGPGDPRMSGFPEADWPSDRGPASGDRFASADPSGAESMGPQPPHSWSPSAASIGGPSPAGHSAGAGHSEGHSLHISDSPAGGPAADGYVSPGRYADQRGSDRGAGGQGGPTYDSREIIPVAAESSDLRPDRSLPGDSGPSANSLPANSPARDGGAQLGVQGFAKAMRTARTHLADGQYREALYTLSIFYGSPDLTADEHRELVELLDPLAGRVVYSTEHLLAKPYEVRRNETLFDIAERHQVPWQLLQNINGVRDPQVLVVGTQLKVVPGPFRAEVDLQQGEVTLFLGRLYAGRFPATFGSDPPPQPGSYEVRDKRSDRVYYGSDGRTISADDPRNPYGGIWLDLGQELSIHGSPDSRGSEVERLGCVSLSPRDARDVYGILSVGSKVVIRR